MTVSGLHHPRHLVEQLPRQEADPADPLRQRPPRLAVQIHPPQGGRQRLGAPRAAAVRAWPGGAILLPHAREMARLLECEPDEVEADPLAAARRAAQAFGAVAAIKGRYSFIVAPDGRAFRFTGGGVGLATSGSGDALAGIVGGLAARGADPLTAALWGVHLHGEAGRALAKRIGRIGFLARELLDEVPGLMER